MDSRRSKNSRSIAIEPKSSRPAARPQLPDRNHSDPAVTRRRSSQTQAHGQGQIQRKEGPRVSDVRISDVIDRDSQASIRDDPFFRPYQSPHSTRLAAESRIAHGFVNLNKDPSKNANLPQVNIVVLGGHRVGKSTFIQKALDLRDYGPTAWSSKKMSLDGVVYVVRLFELLIDDITINDSGEITWPTVIDEKKLPQVDGVLILYDVTNEESVIEIPDLLNALSKSGSSRVLISCKEDNPPQLRQVDLDFNEQIRSRFGKVEICSTSANVPESQKRCISIILRSILSYRKGSLLIKPTSNLRGRATISPGKSPLSDTKQYEDSLKTHYRVSSDLSTSDSNGCLEPSVKELNELNPSSNLAVNVSTINATSPPSLNPQSQTPTTESRLFPEDSPPSPEHRFPDVPRGAKSTHVTGFLRPDTADSQAHNTFLIMEEESPDGSMHENLTLSLSRAEEAEGAQPARDENGSSFDELIDRLLALPMSKQDGKFVPVFLCLYRKFSSPSQVFSAITDRFGYVQQSDDAQLIKVGEQLRYLQVLALWTGDYPGDFAHPSIKKDALAFVSKLEKSRVFAYAAKEISNHLELAKEDEDAEWGRFDGLDALNEAEEPSQSQSEATSPSLRTGKSSSEELLKSSKQSSLAGSYEDLTRRSAAPSVGSSVIRSSNMSSHSLAGLLARNETQQEAQALISIPRTLLSKIQWHQFVESSDDEIARELTRIDWIFYSSIRPRDLVRHVILASDTNKTAKSLENVHRMIDHFNHLFCFVSGMILLRDKPKHRAIMLEKWMTIAWKVRQLNNYNTLGSIIAGTNGTAVHRLTLTWELVPEQIRKDYMRLTILMGTMRSHGAYRMAWENSFSERIPFLPVYRRDLVAAETGNRTFVGTRGDRINWKKFEVMGEVIISMQKSQDKPYKLPRNEDVMRLILETKISQTDEDLAEELYERSLQVEPTVAGDTSRKKFDWLRR